MIYKIVLTGGPCGGKTSVQSILSDTFENMGYKVYRIPESATILKSGGVVYSQLSDQEQVSFNASILKTILTVENSFIQLAKLHSTRNLKTILLCDRGAMDPSAFMERSDWLNLLKSLNFTEVELRDQRYDCVVHLVTAALGAEQFYSNKSNLIRSESLELAKQVDKKLAASWLGHQYFDIVDNSTNFKEKMNRVVQIVLKRLGLADSRSGPNLFKFKYKLYERPVEINIDYRDFEVEHYILLVKNEKTRVRIRKRGSESSYSYTMTTAIEESDGQILETRRSLSFREFEALQLQVDPLTVPIVKKRRVFIWENRYFQIDQFVSPCCGLILMEAYLPCDDKDLLPSFIKIERNVTTDKSFSIFNLSKLQ